MGYPNITDRNLSKGLEEVFYYVNDVTSGWFINMLLIAVYVIIAMGMYPYSRDIALCMASAGFITWLFATILWFAGVVTLPVMIITLVVAVVGFGIYWFSEKD